MYALTIPPDFPVGGYRVEIEVIPEDSRSGNKHEVEKEIVVLFNPWCKGKEKGIERETERENSHPVKCSFERNKIIMYILGM